MGGVDRVLVDEAHTIKSWKTMVARAAFVLSSNCQWCLTGTPLQVQFDQFVAQGKVLRNHASILELLLQLRQCCNHPCLVMR
ncbi:unnamed protein product [Dovyalis caffra]|uniref:SNF2 N-terminal domain-containing protein n=1 Tax=Dovyalis caffra TaxID=77055 RepID=A0AAV1R000_9ROSI|nr:unnamed protein product [Dovyalis caffra]